MKIFSKTNKRKRTMRSSAKTMTFRRSAASFAAVILTVAFALPGCTVKPVDPPENGKTYDGFIELTDSALPYLFPATAVERHGDRS